MYNSARQHTTGEPFFIEQGLKLWEGPMLTLIHTENQDPQAQKSLLDAYFEGQQRLHELAQANLTPKTLNPEFNFMVLDNLLTSYEDFLAYLWLERSQSQQSELNDLFGDLEPSIQSAANNLLESQQKLNEMLKPMVEGVAFEEEVYRPELVKFSLRDGSMARLLGRFKIIQLRSLWNLAEGKLDQVLAPKARQLLDEASREQRRLGLRGLYLGLQDVRFDEVEWLLRQQEPGWQTRSQLLLETLLGEARQQHYPPAQAEALVLSGRRALALGQLDEAQQQVEQAVEMTEKGELGFDLSAAALVERRRRNSRRYSLLSEIKMRRGDPEGALACLEQQRQAETLLQQGLAPEHSRALALREALASERRINRDPVAGLEEALARLDQADWASATTTDTAPQLSSLARLRQHLPASTSVVTYLPLETQLYLFVVRPEGLIVRTTPVARKDLLQAVRNFRRRVADPAKPLADHTQPGRQLYDWLIEPIAQDIASDSILAIVASGYLNYLPFAALIAPDSHPDGPNFLGRHKACVNLVGVSDIFRLSQQPPHGSPRLLALGNPDGTLPAATAEISAIAQGFSDSTVYLGPRAHRQSLRAEGPSPTCLHIATHGHLDSSHPRASYLLLAGSGEEAKLRIPEIYQLPLQDTELVVLSACQTALGEVEPGSEITSLAHAFQVAGGRSVVASLWSVADASTSQFMQALYRNRTRHGLGKALQKSQLELLQQPSTRHPFYWAPFVVLGDFR
jgi:CHAT domain-containing protein